MSMPSKLVSRLPLVPDRGDKSDVVAAVKLHGVITPQSSPLGRGTLNVSSVESALTRAFDHDRLKAVALLINCPAVLRRSPA